MTWLQLSVFLCVVCASWSVDAKAITNLNNDFSLLSEAAKLKAQESMTAMELIQYWGYPAEEHSLVTYDGFMLTMHRIPHGKNGPNPSTSKNRPIFLQHGLEDSSAGWILNLPNKSAAFVFADAGYDVWMGNMRGNTYSREHIKFKSNSHDLWAFSFDEMVRYDLDAQIDYVLKTTGHSDLYYIGHSQGTLTMFSKLSRDPEFNKKIHKFFALAPVGHVKYIKGLIEVISGKYVDILSWYYYWYGESEFVPQEWIISEISAIVCKGFGGRFCDYFAMLIMGVDSNQLSTARTSIYMSHIPAGTSTRNFMHWSQMVLSGNLAQYDYKDKSANMLHYGQETPPLYDLTQINPDSKIYLYWSPSDWLADEKDISEFLIKSLPPSTVIENHMLKDFNHVDFLWGDNAADQVYQPILKTIQADNEQ